MDRAINRQTVAALEGADCTPRAAADHAIDGAGVISGIRESALDLHNDRAIPAVAALISTIALIVTVPIWVVGPSGYG